MFCCNVLIHILGCGIGALRVRRHDAICDVIWHALLQDHSGCKKKNSIAALIWIFLGDVFHPDFQFGKPAYVDVSVCHPLRDSLICLSAATAGVTAGCGEVDKDSHHEASVWAAGGIFVPLVVESLGLWSPNSLAVLRVIALRTTSKSGASIALIIVHVSVEVQLTDVAPPPKFVTQQPIMVAGWKIPPIYLICVSGGFCNTEPLSHQLNL